MSRLGPTKKWINDWGLGPNCLIMRGLLFSLLILFSVNSYADPPVEETIPIVNAEVPEDKQDVQEEVKTPPDKDNKISMCVEDYVKKQNRPHARNAQDNLYNLIHNFDKIALRIFGKKSAGDNKSQEEKIEALAKVQCEMYYDIGILN